MSIMPSEKLFQDFKPVGRDEWAKKIESDLKIEDYHSLGTDLEENIRIEPFYTRSSPSITNQLFRKTGSWKTVQEIFVAEETQANKQALDALNRGADSLLFYLLPEVDLEKLLNDIDIQLINTNFVTEGNGSQTWEKFKAVIDQRKLNPADIHGSINIDSLENLARTGNWFRSEEEDFNELKNLLQQTPAGMKTLAINVNLFGNAGATLSQQNGIALSMAYEYIYRLQLTDSSRFWFNFAIGSDFFGEIARLRAFRRTWAQLQEECNLEVKNAHIYGEVSVRNKTIMDAYNNMIRSTSESMAAAIGGCDEFSAKSFDLTFREPTTFGERIARNQQSILQHESHLDAVHDIARGSYFIEELTEKLAAASWDFFKKIEQRGGYLQSLKDGWLQQQIEKSAAEEQSAFDDQTKVLIGANKHPKKDENLSEIIQYGMFCQDTKGETVVKPVKVKRLSEELEKQH